MTSKRVSVPEGKSLFFKPADGKSPLGEPVGLAAVGAEHKEPTRQSAVFLEERHLDWLEDRCREARKNGGRAVRKAAVIRALLDVALEASVDLTGLRREEDLLPRLRRALRGS